MENGTEKNTAKTGSFFERLRALLPIKTSNGPKGEKKPWYKLPLAKRIFYLVLSVLLAMLLWGYALMAKNPDRKKTFTNITPTLEGSSLDTLYTNYKLTVYGNLSEMLKQVSVTVSAPITDISKIRSSDISASVDLKSVTSAGVYDLEVKATSAVGTVVSVEPSTIRLEFDEVYRRDNIPITYVFTGELPEGYWHSEPVLNTKMINLTGAQRTMESVKRAVCYIDLTDLTTSINDVLQLTVIDKEGNEMSTSSFREVLPSINVEMEVLPHKEVGIGYEIADAELLPDYLKMETPRLTVTSVDIAAPADVLEELDTLVCDPVRLGSITEPEQYVFSLTMPTLPEGAKIIDGTDPQSILLAVNITERTIEQTFDHVAIRFVGESPLYKYEYDITDVSVTIRGPARLVMEFLTSDLTVIVNVEGRGAGEYDLQIETSVDSDRFGELSILLERSIVRTVISRMEIEE